MFIIIGVMLILIGGILIWFHIPYSPINKEFQTDISKLMRQTPIFEDDDVFKSEEFSHLPKNDRAVTNSDGTMEYIPWSAICGEYKYLDTGIKHPTKFQAVWNYPDSDFSYFDGFISEISYNSKIESIK